MYKIAVMGDYDSIYGFAALGLTTVPMTGDPENDTASFRRLAQDEYAVIYVTEAAALTLAPEIEACRQKPLPAVILIPGVSGNTGQGMAQVRKSVEQAVGSDIL